MNTIERPPHHCRDCQRDIRWQRDINDPKGPRCWDCAAAYRALRSKRAKPAACAEVQS